MIQTLTDGELKCLKDKEFLLTKRQIGDKIYQLLSSLENDMKAYVVSTGFPFPKGTLLKSGKISNGENYKGLPFIVLDYPRLFSQKSVFAYRAMIWWGNHFSTTLHIGGEAKDEFAPRLLANFDALKTQDVYVCVNPDPWQYHFEEDNYKHISTIDKEWLAKFIEENDFVKISNKIPIGEYNHYKEFALNNMKKFFSYLLT